MTQEDIERFLDMAVNGRHSSYQFNALDQLQIRRQAEEEQQYSTEAGRKASDYNLNRYPAILPYDYSRIRLIPTDLTYSDSADYINASEVYTPDTHRRYIATQGPRGNTIQDFWRMVWDNVSPSKENTVSAIIMLTQTREGQWAKCAQYWPEPGRSPFQVPYRNKEGEDITLDVRLVSQETNDETDAVISTIEISSREKEATSNLTPRYTIKHMLYTGWRDMEAPISTDKFLNFFRLYRNIHTSSAAPIVHCSAGCGRTGVFIALDYLFTKVPSMTKEQILEDPVFKTVNEIRKWRAWLVFQPDQLQFIYELFEKMALDKLQMPEMQIE